MGLGPDAAEEPGAVLAFPSVFVALVAVMQACFPYIDAPVVFELVFAPVALVVSGVLVFVFPEVLSAAHQVFAVPA